MFHRIALSGKICSGKSTVARKLQKYLKDSEIHTFSTPLKSIVKLLFKNKISRKHLTVIGQALRDVDEDIFVNAVFDNIIQKKNFLIIEDVRYKNELAKCKFENFLTVRLNISENAQRERSIKRNGTDVTEETNFLHKSETDLDNSQKDFDLVINVDKLSVDDIVQKIFHKMFYP